MRILWVWISGPKWNKLNHAGMVKKFQIKGHKISDDFILWFQMIYQWRLGIQPKFFNLLRILWVCVLLKNPTYSVMPAWVDFSDLGWNKFLWFYAFKWYRRYYQRHFINAEWVYKRKLEIFKEFCEFVFLVKNPKKSVMPAWVKISDLGWNNFRWFYAFKWYRTDYWRHFISADWVNK